MTRSGRSLVMAVALVIALAAGNAAGVDASGSAITLSLADATVSPAPVSLAMGQPALIEVGRPVIVVSDSPPGVVHSVVHGSDVLVVPLHEGTTVLSIGLADELTAKLSVAVTAADGVRLVVLSGDLAGPQQAAVPAPPASQPPAGTAARVWLDPRVTVSASTGLAVQAVATLAGGVLYISYVIQNETSGTLHADPHGVEVSGTRDATTVRQMDVTTPGEIPAGSMETGVIACTPAAGRIDVKWRLRDQVGNTIPIAIAVALH